MKAAKRKKLSKDVEKQGPDDGNETSVKKKTVPCFKKPQYQNTAFTHQVKVWKNLKLINAVEKSMYEPGTPTHQNITAPPSTKPIKHFSDLSGLPALYKDPKTKLYYSNKEEYQAILHLSPDIIMGFLALRKAT